MTATVRKWLFSLKSYGRAFPSGLKIARSFGYPL